jgi:hypothetical protein
MNSGKQAVGAMMNPCERDDRYKPSQVHTQPMPMRIATLAVLNAHKCHNALSAQSSR